MSVFEHHVFVCTNKREEGHPKPSCGFRGGMDVHSALKAEVQRRQLNSKVRVNKAGCLSLCALGPTVVIYPEGTWYVGVKPEDVSEILEAMLSGQKVGRLLHDPAVN